MSRLFLDFNVFSIQRGTFPDTGKQILILLPTHDGPMVTLLTDVLVKRNI